MRRIEPADAPGAALHRRPPAAALRDSVETLWCVESGPASHVAERVLPTGSVELVVDLRRRGPTATRSSVVGPHSRYFLLDTSAPVSWVGARFRPGRATALLGVPASTLANSRVALGTLWGQARARSLWRRLDEAEGPASRLRAMETFLAELDVRPRDDHPAVGLALDRLERAEPARTVHELASEAAISAARLNALFHRDVGLSPKLFCRVRRFRRAIERVEAAGARPAWSDLACACGYADQAHLIREFREFSGYSPGEYLEHRTGVPDRLRHA